MSRSVRHYDGLLHTFSDTKQGKIEKRKRRKNLRAKLKDNYEENSPIGKKCHKCNLYDGKWIRNESEIEKMKMCKFKNYSLKRKIHKLIGK